MTSKTQRRKSPGILFLEHLEPCDLLWLCLLGEVPEGPRLDPGGLDNQSLSDRLAEVWAQSPSHEFDLAVRGTKVRFSSGVLSLLAGDLFAGDGWAAGPIGRFEERLAPALEAGPCIETGGLARFSFFVNGAHPFEFETIAAFTTARIQGVRSETGALRLEVSGTVTGSDGVFDDLYGGFTGSSELCLFPTYQLEMRLHFTLGRQAPEPLASLVKRVPRNGNGSNGRHHHGVPQPAGRPFARLSEALKQTLANEQTAGNGAGRDLDDMVEQLASATLERLTQAADGGRAPAAAEHNGRFHPPHPVNEPARTRGGTRLTRSRNGRAPLAGSNGNGKRSPVTESFLPDVETGPAERFIPSAAQAQQEIALVRTTPLSPVLEHWAERYAAVGRRDLYLWRWCRYGVEATILSCVAPALRNEVCDTKVLGIMLNVLVDDVADHKGNDDLLEQLLSFPAGGRPPDFGRQTPAHRAYGELAVDIWNVIAARTRQYPCFELYTEMLRYDYLQLCNSMRYAHLLNGNLTLLNLLEHDLYLPHQMNMMISAAFDLMCSPGFDGAELGTLREVLWHAQCMGRIGNLTTTWERELGERDYTSGVYARAVAHGHLTIADLVGGDRERIRAAILAGGHEGYFLSRWQGHRKAILDKHGELRSMDVAALVCGLERLLCSQLGSRGYL